MKKSVISLILLLTAVAGITVYLLVQIPSDLSLKRGEEPIDVLANIGTFDSQKRCWVVVRFEDQDTKQPPFPKGIHPFVDVEFPPKDKSNPPVKRRYPLAELLGGVLFHGPLQVPDEAGTGMAKLQFSFDSWKDAEVASSTVELPIVGD